MPAPGLPGDMNLRSKACKKCGVTFFKAVWDTHARFDKREHCSRQCYIEGRGSPFTYKLLAEIDRFIDSKEMKGRREFANHCGIKYVTLRMAISRLYNGTAARLQKENMDPIKSALAGKMKAERM